LVSKYGDDYYVQNVSFNTDGTTTLYPLPDGTLYSSAAPFLKLLGVDLALQSTTNSWVTLHPFNFSARNRYSYPNMQTFYGVGNLRYRIQANNLWLQPVPASGQTIRLWYVPRTAVLSGDSDTSDGIGGWLEYVITDAAIKALQKAERPLDALAAQKLALITRIESAAENRDAGFPATVSDSQSSETWGGPGNGFWGQY
jgi:hypothetical protein